MDFRKRLKDVDEVKKYAELLYDVPESTSREPSLYEVLASAVLHWIAYHVLCLLCNFSWVFVATACETPLLLRRVSRVRQPRHPAQCGGAEAIPVVMMLAGLSYQLHRSPEELKSIP